MGRTKSIRKTHREPHHADDLSFMRRRRPSGTGIDYWVVEPIGHKSGGYTTDCETGRRLGEEFLAYIGKHPTNGNAILLNCIVHEMFERAKAGEEWSGIHVGFLRAVNGYAMAMAAALAGPVAGEAQQEAA